MIMNNLSRSGLLLVLLASGCTMIPGYDRPALPVASSWNAMPAALSEQDEQQTTALMDWRNYYGSPEMADVIGIALDNNRDLKIAALNIEEARALYRINRADLFPSLNAAGRGSVDMSSEDLSPTGRAQKSEIYNANVGLSAYEIDLFGKIRSQNEAALNEYLATEQGQAVVRNTLIAETANAYLQLLADQKLLALTEKTLSAQNQTYNLLAESLRRGVATSQDVARARTAAGIAEVNLHQYQRYVEQDKNALILLMGVAYDENLIPAGTLDDVRIRTNLAVGLPSEVLLTRPDIRRAEYELMARNADIGAARAAFFPSITLTGAYGFATNQLSSLFAGGAAGAWSFLPQITLPIFQGGRNVANLDLAEIRKDIAILNYEKAVQVGFREVSDELSARATLAEQLKAQRGLVGAAQEVYDISDARYRSGIDSFLSVLDAQRELYQYQQNEIQTEREYLSNLVNLYKVLGGGAIVTPAEQPVSGQHPAPLQEPELDAEASSAQDEPQPETIIVPGN